MRNRGIMSWFSIHFAVVTVGCAVLVSIVQTVTAIISLENNGYRGITVAIGEGVSEDRALITKIKEIFRLGSPYLHRATRRRAYFAEVTIVVPANWSSHKEYEIVPGGNRFSLADVRVDNPNPLYGNSPHTLQAGGCGEQGFYIHFAPEYLNELHGASKTLYGPPERTLVHEWAHLRYGVYDEYATPQDPQSRPFYIGDDLQIHASGCTTDIAGWLLTNEGKTCTQEENDLPNRQCAFYPDIISGTNDHVKGSIMNMQYLKEVDSFCDDREVAHNPIAPNMHNLVCQGRSTWDVISSHRDFQNNRNPPRDPPTVKPVFRVIHPIQEDSGRYALILDQSASMSQKRNFRLRSAASRFILEYLPNESQITVIAFSNDSKLTVPVTTINNVNRRSVVDRLPQRAHNFGSTAIGGALILAVKTLKKSNINTEGAVFLLVTDGEENVAPFINDVLGELIQAKVQVNALAIGNRASLNLEELTRKTGGKTYYYSDRSHVSHSSVTLDGAFFDSLIDHSNGNNQPVQILNKIHYIGNDGEDDGTVVIDADIGQETKFIFSSLDQTSQQPFSMHVVLLDPTENEIGAWDLDLYRKELKSRSIIITIPDAQPGTWKYIINNHDAQFQEIVAVTITSQPATDFLRPIRIRSWISASNITYPEYATIYAHVHKGYKSVVRATVVAEVDRPNGAQPVRIQLYDNGKGADTRANDGVYSAYFVDYNSNGRYGVVVYATKGRHTVLIEGVKGKFATPRGNSARMVDYIPSAIAEDELPPPSTEFSPSKLHSFDPIDKLSSSPTGPLYIEQPIDSFERTSAAGTFLMNGFVLNEDRLPPNRIKDLRIVKLSAEDRMVTLDWTSPGDDLDHGNASSLEIRYHETSAVFHNFDMGHHVNESHIIAGSLRPTISGRRQRIVVMITNKSRKELRGRVLFFVMRAIDDVGNVADISNVGIAYFPVHVKKMSSTNSMSGLIVLGVLGIVILIISFFVLVVKCMHWKKKRKLSREMDE